MTKEERTDAKAHTFKPLYGGTTGTPNEMEYYKAFVEKYPKLGKWHDTLQTEAISTGVVTMYTGQQFAFPDTKRLSNGNASGAPSIKNYPVQGLAGGCSSSSFSASALARPRGMREAIEWHISRQATRHWPQLFPAKETP